MVTVSEAEIKCDVSGPVVPERLSAEGLDLGILENVSPSELLLSCEHLLDCEDCEKRRGAFCALYNLQVRVIGFRKMKKRLVEKPVIPVEQELKPCCEEKKLKRHDSDIVCISCGLVDRLAVAVPQEDTENSGSGGSKFYRAPNNSVVMDNNMGTAPGPERKKQAMSALNSAGQTAKEGLDFHIATLDLLTVMKMSGDPTDHKVSNIVSQMIKQIEKKRRRVIPKERVSFLAQACKIGVKEGEKYSRLSGRQMRFAIEEVFKSEKLWPP